MDISCLSAGWIFFIFCLVEREQTALRNMVNFSLGDFDQTYFTSRWYIVYDHNFRSGCMIDFPIRIYSKVRWSPIAYKSDTGDIALKKRSFKEIYSVWVTKIHC